jgi:hypothetical protein
MTEIITKIKINIMKEITKIDITNMIDMTKEKEILTIEIAMPNKFSKKLNMINSIYDVNKNYSR